MKLVLVTFLGVVVGIVAFLTIIFLIIWLKIRKTARELGYENIKLKSLMEGFNKIKEENSKTPKSISGMTSLLLPYIRKDFPEFNENVIFNSAKEGLRASFNAISGNDISLLGDYPFLRGNINKIIEEHINNDIEEKYSDIEFSKVTLEDYIKSGGVATIKVSVAVGYYHYKKIGDKVKENANFKKQTRYTCKFIYVYDVDKVGAEYRVLGISCPNCGAVVKTLGDKHCEYCGSAILEINLKSWTFSSFDEY